MVYLIRAKQASSTPIGLNEIQIQLLAIGLKNRLRGGTSAGKSSRGILNIYHGWDGDGGGLVLVEKPILKAIRSNTFLTRVELTVGMACFTLSKILNHLPPQLQELDVSSDIKDMKRHGVCELQSGLLGSGSSPFGLRHVTFSGEMSCFLRRMAIPLLRRCPDLEELQLPSFDSDGDHNDENQSCKNKIEEVLIENCKCLRTPGYWPK